MITKEKIDIYKKFNGDIDGWARASKKYHENMKDEDWYLIDSLIQDINLIQKGLASIEFSNNLIKKLNEICDNENTIELLRIMSKTA